MFYLFPRNGELGAQVSARRLKRDIGPMDEASELIEQPLNPRRMPLLFAVLFA
jgi:hypothetical protein